ncbi:MAG: bifunctional (p)ppGpp synthetase/guanosine-3',5'-bis(diphosphate) 3'-pyrophosphohydrolase [Pseudomonadota bacterium]|nr:bifunctional (p)ppGpp synthetase/guanosine-3',5'-bis(diphosphate) 3'-pyrophosphohydrolase [Pseudomonadota bacterium]
MMRQYQLVEKVRSYDPGADESALNRAYVFSMKAHGSQQRASGDPYFSHPVEVAGILSEKKLDTASIVTGLLHDTVEDTVATLADIERLFGDEVTRLVDGVTKLGQLDLQSDQTKQAENFRKLLLAMSEDIRVLLVKLADRLHNMRTLSYICSSDKRSRIARETMDIYAPLAERIGIRDWKDELEDLAFGHLNGDARLSIINRLSFLRGRGDDLVVRVVDELKKTLAEKAVEADVVGREKKPYSIWRKMQRRDVEFEQLSDIVAFRIIVRDVETCYRTLGIIHSRYQVVPGRFKDYISIPKSNGSRASHPPLMGPQGQRVEVQIRTTGMHEVAEFGVAAHWQYKQGEPKVSKEGMQYRWVRELLEILEHAAEPEEFLEHTKLEMFSDQVFCFSPKGDLFALPFNSTPVDFAYSIHTDIGNSCVAAKVNGRIMPLRTRLKNGDQVEITTSKAQTPSPAWEGFVASGKARACIRRFIRGQRVEQYKNLGREIVENAFARDNYELTRKAIKSVLKKFSFENEIELYAAVGEGQVSGRDVLQAVYPGAKRQASQKNVFLIEEARAKSHKTSHPIPIKGLIPGMAMHFGACCHPLPGDRIVGIVTTGKGVTIHTIDCEALEAFHDVPERWLDVSWERDGSDNFQHTARIFTILSNTPGSLGTLSTVIGRDGGNISNLKVTNRSVDFFELLVDIEVVNVIQLTDIIAALRASSVIQTVERQRG